MSWVVSRNAGPSQLIIADDHPLFRSALRQMIGRQSDLEVVGEAGDGREALELCRRLRPALVLMDVQMPRMDGLAATRAIKREFSDIAVLIVTTFEDPDYFFEAIKEGAAGYVLKTIAPQEMIDAVRGVLSGESPLSRELSALLLRRLVTERQETSLGEDIISPRRSPEIHSGPPLAKSLAPREKEVLRLVACGRTNQEIARSLFLSTSTVKKYVRGVIGKLGVSDRVQAAVRAAELGLLSQDQK
jgi:DNA-binding NarL/FixJ family response regulator